MQWGFITVVIGPKTVGRHRGFGRPWGRWPGVGPPPRPCFFAGPVGGAVFGFVLAYLPQSSVNLTAPAQLFRRHPFLSEWLQNLFIGLRFRLNRAKALSGSSLWLWGASLAEQVRQPAVSVSYPGSIPGLSTGPRCTQNPGPATRDRIPGFGYTQVRLHPEPADTLDSGGRARLCPGLACTRVPCILRGSGCAGVPVSPGCRENPGFGETKDRTNRKITPSIPTRTDAEQLFTSEILYCGSGPENGDETAL